MHATTWIALLMLVVLAAYASAADGPASRPDAGESNPAVGPGPTVDEVVKNVATRPGREPTTPKPIPGVGNFAKVSDALYRGEQPTAEGMKELKKLGVKTIVNLRTFHSDRSEMKGTGMNYAHVRCQAWSPDEDDVVAFLKIVGDPANQPVFVHCWQGSDRTGMMVFSYRVIDQGWTVEEAAKELPNFGFHPVWREIRKYVASFDTDRVKKKLKDAKPPKVEKVE